MGSQYRLGKKLKNIKKRFPNFLLTYQTDNTKYNIKLIQYDAIATRMIQTLYEAK